MATKKTAAKPDPVGEVHTELGDVDIELADLPDNVDVVPVGPGAVPVVVPRKPKVVDADGVEWPYGAIPYMVDGKRVSWSEYVAHEHKQKKQQALDDLDAET